MTTEADARRGRRVRDAGEPVRHEGVFDASGWGSPCGWMRESRAQATLEYALVLFAFLAMVAAIAAMWRAGAEGVFTSLASRAASHALDLGGAVDISLY